MIIPVTEFHLNKAIKAIKDETNERYSCCIISQAISEFVGYPVKTIRNNYTFPSDIEWDLSKPMQGGEHLMDLFDSGNFDELRKLLPAEIEIE